MWQGHPDITNKMEKDVKPNQRDKQIDYTGQFQTSTTKYVQQAEEVLGFWGGLDWFFVPKQLKRFNLQTKIVSKPI